MNLEDLIQQGQTGPGEAPNKKSPLNSLKKDLDFYSESIKEVSSEMVAEGYTLYPIFIAHQHEVSLGEMILDRLELGTQWSIQASSLEEFIEKGVIKEDRGKYFIQNFKDSAKYMCLFVVVPQGANFVYYPYK